MIYEIKDVAKVKRMFEFWDGFDAVDATIRVFVTDPDFAASAPCKSGKIGLQDYGAHVSSIICRNTGPRLILASLRSSARRLFMLSCCL